MKRLFILLIPLLLAGCQHQPRPQSALGDTAVVQPNRSGTYVFGWGYRDESLAKPRGGTTRGAEVQLAPPVEGTAVNGASAFERDRSAILALAGDYRVGFHFMESLGLTDNYTNTRPYFSWATEYVRVIEDRGEFISLQHTLVMFFAGENEEAREPMLTKHWRQDWTYQDTDLHVFKGNRTWARERRSPESVAGAWSQAVFQVDGSPRYEVVGRWEHRGNLSRWVSERDWRPLPRREFSVRADYGVLEGRHQIVLTPTGWVHEQDNWKRVAGESGESSESSQSGEPSPEYLAQEWGLNRYERIVQPSLAAADNYWRETGAYWAEVRQTWREVMAEHDRFRIKPSVDGQSLFEIHFAFADALAEGKAYEPAEGRRHARETILSFLEPER